MVIEGINTHKAFRAHSTRSISISRYNSSSHALHSPAATEPHHDFIILARSLHMNLL